MNEFNSMFDEFFATDRTIGLSVRDLGPVGEQVAAHFRALGYTVSHTQTADGGAFLSLHQNDWFKTILGLKTALNVRIVPVAGGTHVRASIGIFELQIIPTLISLFVFAPIVLGQVWGVIQQNKLDEEAVRVVENALVANGGDARAYTASASHPAPRDQARADAERELGDPAI